MVRLPGSFIYEKYLFVLIVWCIVLIKYSYSLMYVIFCALGAVLMDNLVNEITPIVTLLYVTAIAIFYFHIINLSKMITVYKNLLMTHKVVLLKINILVAVIWVCTYCGNYYSSATMLNYLFFITLGIASRFKTISAIKENNVRFFLGLVLIVFPFYLYPSQAVGEMLSILGGFAAVFYNITTYNMAKKTEITASQTLAVRFWLLLIILLLYTVGNIGIEALTFSVIIKIFTLALLSFVLQIWLSQKGLFSIGVRSHGVLISMTPLVTLILQGCILQTWYFSLLVLTLVCPLVVNDRIWSLFKKIMTGFFILCNRVVN